MFFRTTVFVLLLASQIFAQDVDFTSVFSEKQASAAPQMAIPSGYGVILTVSDENGKTWHGSGVVIASGVLTCAHVVPHTSLTVDVDLQGDVSKATVSKTDAGNDIALLAVVWTKPPKLHAKIAKTPAKPGEEVTSVGFNSEGVLDSKRHSVSAPIFASAIEYSPPPNKGRSGGGIFNQNGELVGLIGGYFTKYPQIGYGTGLDAIRSMATAAEQPPQSPRQQRRAKRRATVFTAESAHKDGWCGNCTALKAKWKDGNDDIEIIYSKDVAPGGFVGDDLYPAVRFLDANKQWRYPANPDYSYRVPSSLEDLCGVIDRAGGS